MAKEKKTLEVDFGDVPIKLRQEIFRLLDDRAPVDKNALPVGRGIQFLPDKIVIEYTENIYATGNMTLHTPPPRLQHGDPHEYEDPQDERD